MRIGRAMVSVLAVMVGGYLLVLGLMFGFQRQLLYLPSRETPDLAASVLAGQVEPVRFETADGLKILSWFRPPPTPDAPVIALHPRTRYGIVFDGVQNTRRSIPSMVLPGGKFWRKMRLAEDYEPQRRCCEDGGYLHEAAS